MVNMAQYFVQFTQEESCGSASPAAFGTKRICSRSWSGSPRGRARRTTSSGSKRSPQASGTCRSAAWDRQPEPGAQHHQVFSARNMRPTSGTRSARPRCGKALLVYSIDEKACKACGAACGPVPQAHHHR